MIRAALIFLFGIIASCPCLVIDTVSSAARTSPPAAHHRTAASLHHRVTAGDACSRVAPALLSSEPPAPLMVGHSAWVQRLAGSALLPATGHLPFVAPDTARALLQVYRL